MDTKDAIRLAIMRSPAAWFETYGAIRKKGGAIVKHPDLSANFMQREISDVVEYCRANRIPCRIISLKPRQKGSSTFYTGVVHRYLANDSKRGCIAGGAHEQGEKLFAMLKCYAEHDDFMPGKAKILDRDGTYPNGSTVTRITAASPHSGTGGTFEVMLCTEVAKWAVEGVSNAATYLSNLLKTVPSTDGAEGTIIILESTAYGAAGDFYDRYQEAITFDQLKAGRRGYVKLFFPWFKFPDSRVAPASEGIESEDDYTEKERELAAQWGLDMEQVAYMRMEIRDSCNGSMETFFQDFPFDEVTAFRKSGRSRFNAQSTDRLREEAIIHKPDYGVFNERDGTVSFRPTSEEEALVWRWEEPRIGCAYLESVDVMTGESHAIGEDPDNHAPLLWRKGYFEAGIGWVPPRLVCRLVGDTGDWIKRKSYQLIWDIDVLAEQVWRMSRYYGDCLIAVENNMDKGILEKLKEMSANLYEEEVFNRRDFVKTRRLGFNTNSKTRGKIIEEMARLVRERGVRGSGVDIHCPILLSEMETFVTKKSGRVEAMSGKHDDNVMSAAIGLTLIEQATVYRQAVRIWREPKDLRLLSGVGDQRNVQYS